MACEQQEHGPLRHEHSFLSASSASKTSGQSLKGKRCDLVSIRCQEIQTPLKQRQCWLNLVKWSSRIASFQARQDERDRTGLCREEEENNVMLTQVRRKTNKTNLKTYLDNSSAFFPFSSPPRFAKKLLSLATVRDTSGISSCSVESQHLLPRLYLYCLRDPFLRTTNLQQSTRLQYKHLYWAFQGRNTDLE